MGQARLKKLRATANPAPAGVTSVFRKLSIDVPFEDYARLAEVAAQITEGHRKRAGQQMLRGWRIVTVGDVARVAVRSYLDALSREMHQIAEWQANAIAEYEAKQATDAGVGVAAALRDSASDTQIAEGEAVGLSTT